MVILLESAEAEEGHDQGVDHEEIVEEGQDPGALDVVVEDPGHPDHGQDLDQDHIQDLKGEEQQLLEDQQVVLEDQEAEVKRKIKGDQDLGKVRVKNGKIDA